MGLLTFKYCSNLVNKRRCINQPHNTFSCACYNSHYFFSNNKVASLAFLKNRMYFSERILFVVVVLSITIPPALASEPILMKTNELTVCPAFLEQPREMIKSLKFIF